MKKTVSENQTRTCVACRTKNFKQQLFRWAVIDKTVYLDWLQKVPGSTLYTCTSQECVKKFLSSKKLLDLYELPNLSFFKKSDEIINHIKEMSRESMEHFLRLCMKSGVLYYGQNIVFENLEKEAGFFDFIILSEDISDKVTNKILLKKKESTDVIRLFTMDLLGTLLNTRPVGVIGFVKSEQASKFRFFVQIFSNFNQEL